jgi:hypothetical protein
MVRKDKEFVPPKDIEDLYTIIDQHKKSTLGKNVMMFKAIFGREVCGSNHRAAFATLALIQINTNHENEKRQRYGKRFRFT